MSKFEDLTRHGDVSTCVKTFKEPPPPKKNLRKKTINQQSRITRSKPTEIDKNIYIKILSREMKY